MYSSCWLVLRAASEKSGANDENDVAQQFNALAFLRDHVSLWLYILHMHLQCKRSKESSLKLRRLLSFADLAVA